TEFKRLGFDYTKETLCTVELSKKLIPGLESYKLGKLCRSLGIPVTDRHRANGDAIATTKLFKLLLDKDLQKTIVKNHIRHEPKIQLDIKLLNILEELPTDTGVYYMHKEDGEIIYIGKSKNIKKRVNQHFTSSSPKSKKIQSLVVAVTYEITGSELVALLKESNEIKQNKPVFNRAQRRTIYTHALYSFIDENGYINLKIDKADGRKNPITTFGNRPSAKSFLFSSVEKFELCQKLTGLYHTKQSCFNYTIQQCKGACIKKESTQEYNDRVNKLIEHNSFQDKSLLIIDRGREVNENSVVLIENGLFKGVGFFDLNYQINHIDVLQSLITPMENNRDIQHIIKSYLRSKKVKKVINLTT
ncbi:MAG: GIY-YIG nuclease family protein, partial [Flavobacteriaceae bacterium]